MEGVEGLLSSEVQQLHEQPRPRTARVNTLYMSVADAVAWLSSPPQDHCPPGTDLHDHPLVQSAHLILQVAPHLVCNFRTCKLLSSRQHDDNGGDLAG